MLNLTNVLEYTGEERKHVENVLVPLGKKAWKDQKNLTFDIKHRLSTFTIKNQGGRCAYCEMPLRRGGAHLEHFLPKEDYGKFTFEPLNLFTSCPSCNAPGVKGADGIVVSPGNTTVYEANVFKIVHPILHNPDDHIKYTDETRCIFDRSTCTTIGNATIDFFEWEDYPSINDRIDRFRIKDIPIDVVQLVQRISTYKR